MNESFPAVSPEVSRGRSRSLVPALLGVLALQGCLYLGMRASPLMADYVWRPAPEAPNARVQRWRQAQYDPAQDPRPGLEVPAVDLPAGGGRRVALVSDQSLAAKRWTVLVFISEAG